MSGFMTTASVIEIKYRESYHKMSSTKQAVSFVVNVTVSK